MSILANKFCRNGFHQKVNINKKVCTTFGEYTVCYRTDRTGFAIVNLNNCEQIKQDCFISKANNVENEKYKKKNYTKCRDTLTDINNLA